MSIYSAYPRWLTGGERGGTLSPGLDDGRVSLQRHFLIGRFKVGDTILHGADAAEFGGADRGVHPALLPGRSGRGRETEQSYHAVDELVAASGVDPDATARPSLYQAFHTSNAEQVVTAAGLTVQERLDQEHRFRFADLDHPADYAATSPKYRLPSALTAEPRQLAAALRRRLSDRPIAATSTVTYLIAVRP